MKKIKVLTWIGIAIGLLMAMGCAMELETQFKKAGQTDRNDIFATAARVRNPMGQEAIAIEIHAEARQPEVAYQRTTITSQPAAPQAAPEFVPPTKSPRGKKANIVPCAPAPKPQPVQQQVVVDEVGYYPSTTPLANAGGVGEGFLKDWVGKAIGAAGFIGGNMVAPGTHIKVGGGNATGGNASARQQQGQGQVSNNTNINSNRNNNNPVAISGSSSSSSAAGH